MADIEMVIEELNNAKKVFIGTYSDAINGLDVVCAIDEAIQTIRELQEQIPKWHLCENELPSESGFYMAKVYCRDCDMFDYRKTFFAHEKDFDESEWRELYSYERVIAWMELSKFEEKNK